MASQAERDTARARARTQADTARAQGQTSSRNAQTQADTERARARTQADTARARSRQNGGDGGTSERMSQREAAAGLSNTTSNRNNLVVTMEESSVYPNEFEADFKRNLGLGDSF
jgi:DNA invertase Pin-like site-specific DNA recombinase